MGHTPTGQLRETAGPALAANAVWCWPARPINASIGRQDVIEPTASATGVPTSRICSPGRNIGICTGRRGGVINRRTAASRAMPRRRCQRQREKQYGRQTRSQRRRQRRRQTRQRAERSLQGICRGVLTRGRTGRSERYTGTRCTPTMKCASAGASRMTRRGRPAGKPWRSYPQGGIKRQAGEMGAAL